MEIKNDFLVEPNQEHWVGVVITINSKTVWIFEEPIHGCDIYLNITKPNDWNGQNWSQWRNIYK